MQKITPCLMYDSNAEEAMDFYVSIFQNSKVNSRKYYGDGAPMPKGTFLTGTFQLEGQDFMVLNGGPHWQFTGAISLMVSSNTQEEVDTLWTKLTADGGEDMPCSWVKDKYGVHWQIVPVLLMQYMSDPDPVKAGRVMQAMLKMKKIDIAKIQEAYDGK